MLAFGIRYLTGFATARSAPDDLEAEWPPHPGRVFMALAAAHFQTGADPGERRALLWLEALETNGEPMAPNIVAADVAHRAVVTQYVPVNDESGPSMALLQSAPLTRERRSRTFTRAWLTNDTAFLLWTDAYPDEEIRSALESLCGKVTRLGHSSSLVQMWVARPEDVGEPTWMPDEGRAETYLRIAPAGTLEYLEQRFNAEAVRTYTSLKAAAEDPSNRKAQRLAKRQLKEAFADGPPHRQRPSLSVNRGYARPLPPSMNTVAGTIFSPHLIIQQLDRKEGPYRHLDLSCMLALTQRWRQALVSHSNDLSASVRTILSGHDDAGAPLQGSHLAFIPLAFVDREHADGHLLGMGIALPNELSVEDRREIRQAVDHTRELRLGRLGIWRVEEAKALRPPQTLNARIWTAHPKGATTWSTVTPIVFDQHPKSREKTAYQAEVAGMIKQCCMRLGLPAPREAIPTPVSAHLGPPPAYAFPRLQRKDGSQRRHVHAILVFDEPVCGPMILGAGRYRGYGACRPMDTADA